MKLWLDDVGPAPEGYVWCKSVNKAKSVISKFENKNKYFAEREWGGKIPPIPIKLIDLDHDAGEFACDGGDYIKLLNWLEETGRNYPIRIHSANAIDVQNMRRIIERNGWKEVL